MKITKTTVDLTCPGASFDGAATFHQVPVHDSPVLIADRAARPLVPR
jgi:hypothetical protein